MQKNILVTGAAGFIGSHLCEALLTQGYRVAGIDNFDPFYKRSFKENNLEISLSHSNFIFISGDAGDANTLDQIPFSVDLVIHLAAKAGVLPSLKDPLSYVKTNIEMTNLLLEWMKQKQIRKFVFGSSSSVYGNNSPIPFKETESTSNPISPYAYSKKSCELIGYTYHTLYDLDVVNLRFFTVYGERQRPDLAIRRFVRGILTEQPLTIYGDGTTARDYTYYSDIVTGITKAVEYQLSTDSVFEIFNIGNNNPVSLIDLIHTISKVAGVEPVLKFEEMKPGDMNITYADISKAKKVLGYEPVTSLEQGLENFINWYRPRVNNEA